MNAFLLSQEASKLDNRPVAIDIDGDIDKHKSTLDTFPQLLCRWCYLQCLLLRLTQVMQAFNITREFLPRSRRNVRNEEEPPTNCSQVCCDRPARAAHHSKK